MAWVRLIPQTRALLELSATKADPTSRKLTFRAAWNRTDVQIAGADWPTDRLELAQRWRAMAVYVQVLDKESSLRTREFAHIGSLNFKKGWHPLDGGAPHLDEIEVFLLMDLRMLHDVERMLQDGTLACLDLTFEQDAFQDGREDRGSDAPIWDISKACSHPVEQVQYYGGEQAKLVDVRCTNPEYSVRLDAQPGDGVEKALTKFYKNFSIVRQPAGNASDSQLGRVAREIAESVVTYRLKSWTNPGNPDLHIQQALQVVGDVRAACNMFVGKEHALSVVEAQSIESWSQRLPADTLEKIRQGMIWFPVDVNEMFREGDEYLYGFQIDVESLSRAIDKYLAISGVRSVRLDWIMLDALMFSRVKNVERAFKRTWPGPSLFGESIANSIAKGKLEKLKMQAVWLLGLQWVATYALIVGIPVVLLWRLVGKISERGVWTLQLLWLGALILWALRRYWRQENDPRATLHRKLQDTYVRMAWLYSQVHATGMTARTMHSLLMASEASHNCAWPAAAYNLLDDMAKREA